MKKFFALCASMLLVSAVFTGCGNDKNDSMAENNVETSETQTDTEPTVTTDDRDNERETENTRETDRNNNDNGGIIDGVESAGEDIIDGAGDAAEDIVDGITGDDNSDTTSTTEKRR